MPGEFQGRTRPDSSASTTSTFLRCISQNRALGVGSRLMSSQNVALIELERPCVHRTPARALTSQRVAHSPCERGQYAAAGRPADGHVCRYGVHFATRALTLVASAMGATGAPPWTSPRPGAAR